jgi:hypothetical protein
MKKAKRRINPEDSILTEISEDSLKATFSHIKKSLEKNMVVKNIVETNIFASPITFNKIMARTRKKRLAKKMAVITSFIISIAAAITFILSAFLFQYYGLKNASLYSKISKITGLSSAQIKTLTKKTESHCVQAAYNSKVQNPVCLTQVDLESAYALGATYGSIESLRFFLNINSIRLEPHNALTLFLNTSNKNQIWKFLSNESTAKVETASLGHSGSLFVVFKPVNPGRYLIAASQYVVTPCKKNTACNIHADKVTYVTYMFYINVSN